MPARAHNKAGDDPRQARLFESDSSTPPCGSFNFDREWRAAVTEAISQSPRSRAEIAAEMERLLGNDPDYPVSVAMLNAWTAPSKSDWRFPLIYLPALVKVIGGRHLVEMLAAKCGLVALTRDEEQLVEIGRLQVRQRDDKRRLQHLLTQRGRPR